MIKQMCEVTIKFEGVDDTKTHTRTFVTDSGIWSYVYSMIDKYIEKNFNKGELKCTHILNTASYNVFETDY